MLVANLVDIDPPVGVVGGSVSLSGGHGTAIAWNPVFRDDYRIQLAGESGEFWVVVSGLSFIV